MARLSNRGMTLLELMIVVAIIAVLAATAAPSFINFIHRGKTSEATLQLNKLGKSSKRMMMEIGTYSATDGQILPAGGGAAQGHHCCGGVGGILGVGTPNTKVINVCTADPDAFYSDPGWLALDFSVDEASQYRYSYHGDPEAPIGYAIGDIDCDDSDATYTLQMTKSTNGNPQQNLVPPLPGVL